MKNGLKAALYVAAVVLGFITWAALVWMTEGLVFLLTLGGAILWVMWSVTKYRLDHGRWPD